MKISLAVTRNW